jgi:hypothetical protein
MPDTMKGCGAPMVVVSPSERRPRKKYKSALTANFTPESSPRAKTRDVRNAARPGGKEAAASSKRTPAAEGRRYFLRQWRMRRLTVRALLLAVALAIQPGAAPSDTLYWFAPLPPMPERPGRLYVGSDDFMDLFSPDAPWQSAARHIQVLKLYGEWVLGTATDEQLRRVVTDLARRGIALGVEGGPLKANACGGGVEGFAEPQWARIAGRIKAAGGIIDYIDMDEPFYYAHFYHGPKACHWSTEAVAHEIGAFIQQLREQFPDVVIGDAEPLLGQADAGAYRAWIDAF